MPPTRSAFIRQYRNTLMARHDWARDTGKLIPFMQHVASSIEDMTDNDWRPDSAVADAAWQAIGGRGIVTLTILRALPD